MAGSNHAILDLGEDDLQFTTNDYKVQIILKDHNIRAKLQSRMNV